MRKSSSIQGMHTFNMKRDTSKESINTSIESNRSRNVKKLDQSNSKMFYIEENIKINDSSLRKSYGKKGQILISNWLILYRAT